MNPLRVRSNGTWVNSNTNVKLRVNGVWIEYGVEGAIQYESLMWPNPVPALTDAEDAGATYNLGIRFHLLQPKPCYGVRWRVPDSTPLPNGGPHAAVLWNRITENYLAFKEFTPTPGQYQDILFDTAVALDDTPAEYVVSVYTSHYVFRAPPTPGDDWTVLSTSGNVVAFPGQLKQTTSYLDYPASTFNALYYVSPLIGT